MPGTYPETSWSLIERARAPGDDGVAARQIFHERYQSPVFAYVRALAWNSALDPVQVSSDFFTDQVWMGKILASASRDHSRFRYFLKTCVRNYVTSRLRELKPVNRLDTGAEAKLAGGYAMEPEYAFEQERARDLLARAINAAEQHCIARNEHQHFEAFRRRYLGDATRAPGWASVGAGLPLADGSRVDVDHRTARSMAETVSERVRRAMLDELRLRTGSAQQAAEELELLAGVMIAE